MSMGNNNGGFPEDFFTGDRGPWRRLRVDDGETGFFEGRQFALRKKLEIPAGTPLVYKFTIPVDFILFEQALACSDGDIEFYAHRAANVTETGTFSTVVQSVQKNISSTRRLFAGSYYSQQAQILTGGGITIIDPDNYADYDRVKTANATGQLTTIGGGRGQERYLSAGSYYLIFSSLSGTSTGRYTIAWEERP